VTHLQEAHSLSVADYLKAHPAAATMSTQALDAWKTKQKKVRREAAPAVDSLTVALMGFQDIAINEGVEADLCLPLPDGYQFPTKGKAKKVMHRVLMALIRRRNLFFWGMPGTGKDAAIHAFSALTRTPCVMVTFRPGTDLAPWFYTRSIDENGTGWEFGHLWTALTEGILCRDGVRRAPLVLLSDVDRADSAQAEWFRILVDSISGRILDPSGQMVPLIVDAEGNKPMFCCTANSCGSGDARGRMASSNPMDASLLDRLGRKMEAEYLDWTDESRILQAKFPRVAQAAPSCLGELGNACKALRDAIKNELLYAELTHRGLCEIMLEADDILHFAPHGKAPANLMVQAFRAWLDGLDADSILEAKRLADPHLKGGTL
tara:strand:- start:2786 stop:3916 length:1131 start_codon:yes stop_codon:yes gene_type:complete